MGGGGGGGAPFPPRRGSGILIESSILQHGSRSGGCLHVSSTVRRVSVARLDR